MKKTNPREETRSVRLRFFSGTWKRLEALADSYCDGRVDQLIRELLDHVDQGIYRPGSWERAWLAQVFGDEAVEEAMLEGPDPHTEEP